MIIGRIRDEQRFARGHDDARETFADLDPRRGHGGERIATDAGEDETIPLHHPDPHRIRVEERRAGVRHVRHQGIERQDLRKLPGHLQQRLEPCGKRGQFLRLGSHLSPLWPAGNPNPSERLDVRAVQS
jgi:hypothetical protein